VTYLAYGALQSEPHSETCNGLGHQIDAASGSTLAVGMVLMLVAVIYSAYKCAFPVHPLIDVRACLLYMFVQAFALSPD
jgi:Serine incorporator (Serinc)